MKFTPEVKSTILLWLRNGCFRFQACAAAGISRRTLNAWETTAREDPNGEHAEFVEQMQIAEDSARAKLAAINNALATGTMLQQPDGAKNPIVLEQVNIKALHFQMERGGDRSWGEIQKLEHTGKDGAPLETGPAKVIILPAKETD